MLRKEFLDWLGRLRGQVAGAIWDYSMGAAQFQRMGFIADLAGPHQRDLSTDYLKWHKANANELQTTQFKNVEIISDPAAGALALAGRHVLATLTAESAKEMLDGLLKHQRRTPLNWYKRLIESWGGDPDIMLEFDAASNTAIGRIARMINHDSDTEGAYWTLTCGNDVFVERLAIASSAQNRKESAGKYSEELFSHVPGNALAAGGGEVDAKIWLFVIKELNAKLKPVVERFPDPTFAALFDGLVKLNAMVQQFDRESPIKSNQLAESMSGPLAYWLEAKSKGTDAFEGGVVVSFQNKAAASTASDGILKWLKDSAKLKVNESAVRDWVLYEVGDSGFVWTIHENRMCVCSSLDVMKRYLNGIAERAPMLSKNPYFVKTVNTLTEAERGGEVFYLNLAEFLRKNADVDKDATSLEQVFAALSAQPALADLPGVIASLRSTARGAELVIRSPIPVVPTVISGVIFAEDTDEGEDN